MSTTAALDDTAGVLAELRARQAAADAAEADKIQLAVAWAAMHSTDSIMGPVSEWSERPVVVAGPGAPAVAEFCVPELGCVLGISHDAAAGYLGECVELAHRLPKTYARVLSGEVRAWKARRIARETIVLSAEAAAFVDTHVAPVTHKVGGTALGRLVETAAARFDPELAEQRRTQAAEHRRLDIDLAQVGIAGTAFVTGCLDAADALDLETAIRQGAADLAVLGSTDTIDVRRSQAAGVLARGQNTIDLNPTTDTGPAKPRKVRARQVVIYVHLADASIGRIEGPGGGRAVTVEQVRRWCSDPHTATDTQVIVRPVIDLNATPTTTAYEIPELIREQIVLRDLTCVFPHCTRQARTADADHITNWAPGDQTTPAHLAPLCRRHHRLKTHTTWTYRAVDPGTYQWTSPHGLVITTGRPPPGHCLHRDQHQHTSRP